MNTKKGSQPLNFNPKGPLQSLDGENCEGKRRKPRGKITKTASLNLGFSRIIALFSQFYLAVFGIFAVLPRGFSRFSWFLRSKDCAGLILTVVVIWEYIIRVYLCVCMLPVLCIPFYTLCLSSP